MDAFFSLQAVIMCFAVAGIVQVLKKVLDRVLTREKRKASRTLDVGLVGLALPLLVGVALSVSVPVHPQSVLDYAAKNFEGKEWQVFALYGLMLGQVADYAVAKWKRIFKKWAETADAKKPDGV